MQLFSWLHKRMTGRSHTRRTSVRKPTLPFRPRLEALEGRDLPSLGSPVTYAVSQPLSLTAADVNGDGKPDLIALAGNGDYASVQLNNGNGTFGTGQSFYDSQGPATAMAVGDVNGDGMADILFTEPSNETLSAGSPSLGLTLLLGEGQGWFQAGTTSWVASSAFSMSSLALFNLSGSTGPAVVGASQDGGAVTVAHYEGYVGYYDTYTQSYSVPAAYPSPSQAAVGDFNGDGKPDIVVTDSGINSVSLLLNIGNGNFGTAQTYAVGGSPTAVAVGDVNGDGHLDIVTANANGTVTVLLGQGNGTFAAGQTYTLGGAANSVALGDFNHDGKLDIATTGAEMDVLLNSGNGTFGPYQTVGPAGSNVVAADFNGDGYTDLAQIDASQTKIDVLFNSSQGSLAVAGFPSSTTAGAAHTITVTALNADGSINTGFTGTVQLTCNDPQAILPASYSFKASDHGVHSFSVTLETAGTQSLSATAANGLIGGESGITVTPAAAATLVFGGVPTDTDAGSAFTLMLTAMDAYGNQATGYTGTVHFSSSDPHAVLPADYTFTGSDLGYHIFYSSLNPFALETAGTQSLAATDTATGITSTANGIVVFPGAPAKFLLSAPSSVTSGQRFSLTLTVEDAYGNVVTNWAGYTVQFSSSDRTATLPANYTFTTADAGVHTFNKKNSFMLKNKGIQTITITDLNDLTVTDTISIDVM
jgi:hypothetical protein